MGSAVATFLVYMIIFFIAKKANVINSYYIGECYFLAMLVRIFTGDDWLNNKATMLTLKSVPILIVGFIIYAFFKRFNNGGEKDE